MTIWIQVGIVASCMAILCNFLASMAHSKTQTGVCYASEVKAEKYVTRSMQIRWSAEATISLVNNPSVNETIGLKTFDKKNDADDYAKQWMSDIGTFDCDYDISTQPPKLLLDGPHESAFVLLAQSSFIISCGIAVGSVLMVIVYATSPKPENDANHTR